MSAGGIGDLPGGPVRCEMKAGIQAITMQLNISGYSTDEQGQGGQIPVELCGKAAVLDLRVARPDASFHPAYLKVRNATQAVLSHGYCQVGGRHDENKTQGGHQADGQPR